MSDKQNDSQTPNSTNYLITKDDDLVEVLERLEQDYNTAFDVFPWRIERSPLNIVDLFESKGYAENGKGLFKQLLDGVTVSFNDLKRTYTLNKVGNNYVLRCKETRPGLDNAQKPGHVYK